VQRPIRVQKDIVPAERKEKIRMRGDIVLISSDGKDEYRSAGDPESSHGFVTRVGSRILEGWPFV
jgi:hypothetical protein